MAYARALVDIDSRIEYINTQTMMGAETTELVDEQYRQLLNGFSMLRDVDLNGVTGISSHLIKQKVFSNVQLLAFSASLRAAAAAYQTKPTGRGMQSNRSLQHYLVQTDWDRLDELGKQPTLGSEPLEDIVALKMHALGIVCPDADTLKRASAIVQVMFREKSSATDKRLYGRRVQTKVKKLDSEVPWAFAYIIIYPRSPCELPPDVSAHAYGDAVPVNMPGHIEHSAFHLMVASTRYKKEKTCRLDQTRDEDQTSNLGATDGTCDIVPRVAPPLTMDPSHMMNAGPFAAMMSVMMHGIQQMGSSNTYGRFKSKVPLQLANLQAELHNQPTDGDAAPAAEEVQETPAEKDELANLEAEFAVSKKEADTVKRAIKKAAKAKATPKAAAPKGKRKTAASKAKGKAEAPIPTDAAPTAKGKAAAPHGAGKTAKGKPAAPKGAGKTAKGKAAAPKGKGKGKGKPAPAGGAVPPGEFPIDAWIDEHVTRAEAKGEPKRKNFVSNIHKRSRAAAELFGADPVQPITKRARDAAAEMHDGLHKKW